MQLVVCVQCTLYSWIFNVLNKDRDWKLEKQWNNNNICKNRNLFITNKKLNNKKTRWIGLQTIYHMPQLANNPTKVNQSYDVGALVVTKENVVLISS